MVSSLSLLLNRNMIFRLKNGSSRQFLISKSYTWSRKLHVVIPVLQSEMCWSILTLNPLYYLILFFQYMFLFCYTFYISNNIWHWLSGSQFPCKSRKPDHLTLYIYWFNLNNFDIFCIFYHCIFKLLVF